MKVKEAIELLNNHASELYSIYDAEGILNKSGANYKKVASDLEIDENIWYATSTSVYKLEDGYIGINGVSDLFGIDRSYTDCDILCTIEEYEKIQTVFYKPKEN